MAQPILPEIPPKRITARIITYKGNQFALLALPPNWDTEVKISLDLPTDVSKEPITFSESRRNFAGVARYKMEYTGYLCDAAAATELRIFLTRIRGMTVIAPLWTDQCEIARDLVKGDTVFGLIDVPARYGLNWIIANEDFSLWEIVTLSSINISTKVLRLALGIQRANDPVTHIAYPKGTFIYPIIAGRLEEQPQPEQITDETSDVSFKIKENTGIGNLLIPASNAMPLVGSQVPGFSTLPKWTVAPNFSRPLDWTEMPDIVYEQVGFLRNEQQREYDHRTSRGQELEFYQAERDSVARIEYLWWQVRATTKRFMIPTYRGDLRMKRDTPIPGDLRRISCERSFYSNPGRETEPGDPYIAVIDNDDVVWPYQITNVTDDAANDATHLYAKHNVHAHTAATSILCHLLLARFAEATLEWTYTTPYLSSTRIKFQEVAMEYPNNIVPIPPPPLPEPAYLFIFKEAGVRTDRYTSYEKQLVVDSGLPSGTYKGTYIPAPFNFDKVKVGLKLDEEKLDLKSFKFPGNPLNKMWPFALDGILTVQIVEVNAANPLSSTAVSRFYGDVWSVDSEYKATAVPFGNLFERKFPRFLLSVSDNYTQFSLPTHISASSFQIPNCAIKVTNPNTFHTSQTIIVTNTTAHGKATDYFAGGWLETGSGNAKEKRGILHSAAATGSDVTLDIDRPLLKAVNNQGATLFPGYDGSIDQCDTKFNNRVNFGGHPFIPNVNPGVKAMKTQQTKGGKKG